VKITTLLVTALGAAVLAGAPSLAWPGDGGRCGTRRVEAAYEAVFEGDDTALAKLEECAADGDGDAQAYLGMVYWSTVGGGESGAFGLAPGLSSDERRARGWRYLRAAAQEADNGIAYQVMGEAFYTGSYGVSIDLDEARTWFEQAERAGEEISGFNLAIMYAEGAGVASDFDKALRHLRVSARRSYPPAQCALATWRTVRGRAPSDQRLKKLKAILNDVTPHGCPGQGLFDSIQDGAAQVADSVADGVQNLGLTAHQRVRLATAQRPDDRMCAAYRGFKESLPDSDAVFLRPTTYTEELWRAQPGSDGVWVFYRETGEYESITMTPGAEPYLRQIMEPFEFAASPLLASRVSGPEVALTSCFEGRQENSLFWLGSLRELYRREQSHTDVDDLFLSVWSVSKVGFSADGAHALVYAEGYCGALCASGGYYLLEYTESAGWTIVGERILWVS